MAVMNLLTLSTEDTQKFYELYLASCENTKTRPSMSDFCLWFEEEYGDASV